MYLTKRSISRVLSSIASSILISMILAPSSICFAAILSASSYFPSAISLANFLDPATFVRSPMLVKLLVLLFIVTASRPLTFISSVIWAVFPDDFRGARPDTASAIARMWSGEVPQHPPTIFTRPRDAISLTCAAISAGDWSYPPISFGSPALG